MDIAAINPIHTEKTDAHGIKTVTHVEFGNPGASYLKFFDPDGNELADGKHRIGDAEIVISVPSCHGTNKNPHLRKMMAVKTSRYLHVVGESMLVAIAPVRQ